jgi:hypothetical protein
MSLTKNGRRKRPGSMNTHLPLVQRHLLVAGTVVDILSVRVPSTMEWLREAGIHVSDVAQKQTCRAVFHSLCNDVEFCSELTGGNQAPSSQVINGYIDRHIQGVVGRALRSRNGA